MSSALEPKQLVMSPYGAHLGIALDCFGEGEAVCSIALKDQHYNAGGRVHGGVLMSLADTVAGVAVRSLRPEGAASATTDLNISFIRPPMGDFLEARATVLHRGKRLYRVEISVFSGDTASPADKKLVARCNATFMIVFPESKPS